MHTNTRQAAVAQDTTRQPQLFDDPPRMSRVALTHRARLLSLRAEFSGNPKSKLGRMGDMISLVVESAHELNAPAMLEDAVDMLQEAVEFGREARRHSAPAQQGGHDA